ncbi:TPA: hypothetical protein ACK8SK_002613 [Legionella pneumophila]|nr:hypothetical protein [Legionella pneumophila subsp. pneumophila]
MINIKIYRAFLGLILLVLSTQVFSLKTPTGYEYPFPSKYIKSKGAETLVIDCDVDSENSDHLKCEFTDAALSYSENTSKKLAKELKTDKDKMKVLSEVFKDTCEIKKTKKIIPPSEKLDIKLLDNLCKVGVNEETIMDFLAKSSEYEKTKCELFSSKWTTWFDHDNETDSWVHQSKPNNYLCGSISISRLEQYKGAFGHKYWKYTINNLYPKHGSGKLWDKGQCNKISKHDYEEFLSEFDETVKSIVTMNCQKIILTNMH